MAYEKRHSRTEPMTISFSSNACYLWTTYGINLYVDNRLNSDINTTYCNDINTTYCNDINTTYCNDINTTYCNDINTALFCMQIVSLTKTVI